MNFKKYIINILAEHITFTETIIEIPPDSKMGDFSIPCFSFAKELKKSPAQISLDVVEKIQSSISSDDIIKEIKSIGPYINIFINKSILIKSVVEKIQSEKDDYGNSDFGKQETVIVEYPAPNTNKPLHLGHLRNISMGSSMANIIQSQGYKTFRINLNNDRGIHICKSMLAYKKWGEGKTPESEKLKSDHFVGKYYVLFNQKLKENPELEKEAQEMLKLWEAKDSEVRALWKKMNDWALTGFNETYETLEIPKFDKVYYESETFEDGKKTVLEGLEKGVFKKNKDGAIIIDLTKEGFDEKVLLRADGTTVYMTQDIHLAKLKHDDFSYTKSVYVVGSEQQYHFDVLFKILEKLGYSFAKGCYHFSYGLVNLPDGRMKSREGTVVDTDDLIKELKDISKQEIEKRYSNLSEEEVTHRSKVIALGAVKFYLVANDPIKDITFDPNKSLSFEGDTGPYIQYTYARASSIVRKAKEIKLEEGNDFSILVHDKEIELVKLLGELPDKSLSACKHYKPHLIAQYLLSLCRTFNEFYHTCGCINEENKVLAGSRLTLINTTRQVIKNGLKMLGVETLEQM